MAKKLQQDMNRVWLAPKYRAAGVEVNQIKLLRNHLQELLQGSLMEFNRQLSIQEVFYSMLKYLLVAFDSPYIFWWNSKIPEQSKIVDRVGSREDEDV